MILSFGELNEQARNALNKVAKALRELGEALLEYSKACVLNYLYVVSPSDYVACVDTPFDIDSIVTTWTSIMDASLVYTPRKSIPKTPYKPSYKTVIFDRRLKFPKCRSNC